jgi:hypothetical protein
MFMVLLNPPQAIQSVSPVCGYMRDKGRPWTNSKKSEADLVNPPVAARVAACALQITARSRLDVEQ